MPTYVDLPAGHQTVGSYATALLGFLSQQQPAILVLLRNIVGFHTEQLWGQLPPGWGDALSALAAQDLTAIVCLAHPDAPVPAQFELWPPSLRSFVRGSKRLALSRRRITDHGRHIQALHNAAAANGESDAATQTDEPPAPCPAAAAVPVAASEGVGAERVFPTSACPFVPSEMVRTLCAPPTFHLQPPPPPGGVHRCADASPACSCEWWHACRSSLPRGRRWRRHTPHSGCCCDTSNPRNATSYSGSAR
jgi:hypothetical protein